MKYLITGATGFIGSRLARELCRRGESVVALVRETSDLSPLTGLSLETFTGDLRDIASVRSALDGIDVVFHCAGVVGDWGPSRAFRRTNVEGAQHLLVACAESNVRRVVVVSSLSVYGIKRHEGTSEEAPFIESGDHYSDSKISAERMMAPFLQSGKPPLTIVRPGFVYGPGDRKFVPRLLKTLREKRFAFIGDGESILNIVYIDDVIQALLLAATSQRAEGRAYNITDGTRTTAHQFIGTLAELDGLEVPAKHIPFKVAYVACRISEMLSRLFRPGRRPRLTRAALKLLGVSRFFSIERALEELEYEPQVGCREGLERSLRWLTATATREIVRADVRPATRVT